MTKTARWGAIILAGGLLLPVCRSQGGGHTNAPGSGNLRLDEALLLALERNRALRVQRYEPDVQQAAEGIAAAAFDPALSAAVSEQWRRSPDGDRSGWSEETGTYLEIGATWQNSYGTRLDAGVEMERVDREGREAQAVTRAGVQATQPLQRGRARSANLAMLHQAELDSEYSRYELRAVAESLVERVEAAYLDCVLANRRLEIVTASLELAERQQEEIRQRIRVGGLPGTELAAAKAEVAMRQEALINARSSKEIFHIRLTRLVDPQRLAAPAGHGVTVDDTELMEVEDQDQPLAEHLDAAWLSRPELQQARLMLKRGDVELVRTADGLLPRLDVFLRLGRTGYADAFGASLDELGGDGYDAAVGLSLEWPLRNRAARGAHLRASWMQQQREEALRNVEDLIREDVHTAYLEVCRARQQVTATAATRELQEEKLRAETAKYAAGESTALFVAQAQRDLLSAQVSEVEALIQFRKAQVALFRLDGSLLARRGLTAP